jgi:adenylate kinase family enzyme
MNRSNIINIFGYSTSGKTTIAVKLKEHLGHLYTVDYDVVKKQITGYEWKRDGPIAKEITYDTLNSAAKTDMLIVALLPPPKLPEEYERIKDVASTNNRNLLNIEIIAPHEVLIDRYTQRLTNTGRPGMKTLDEFKESLRDRYYRPDNTHTFDSSANSPDQIFEYIKNLL